MKNTALVVVDMLYDFIDGSLACENAEQAVAETLKFIDKMTASADGQANEILDTYPIIFIRDHHPADHSSFAEQGGIWPAHCVAGTRGGEIHAGLAPYAVEELTFDKGCDRAVEQYSGFDGVNAAGQSLGEVLGLLDLEEIFVCGIATEYCVRNTVEDLVKAGHKVTVLKDCLAWVDKAGHEQTLKELGEKGISIR